MTVGDLKCQNCGKSLFFFIPRLNLSHFNNPTICKHCNSVNIIKGKPDLGRFDFVSLIGSLFFIALILASCTFEPLFFKNPFFYLIIILGIILTNLSNYFFFKRYIEAVEQLSIEDGIDYLKKKDIKESFHMPNLISVRSMFWLLSIFVMLSIAIYINRGIDDLIKFLVNPYVIPSLIGGTILGQLLMMGMSKALVKSMEKQKQVQINKLSRLRSEE